jgi:hypothetical protein
MDGNTTMTVRLRRHTKHALRGLRGARTMVFGWRSLMHGAAVVAVMSGLILCPALAHADDEASAEATAAHDPHPEMSRLSPTEKVWLDRDAGLVVVGGEVALQRGQIEFFACPRRTKEHESVVVVDASARLVHTGLLAIGMQAGEPVQFAPEYRAARGPQVRVEVRWTDAEGKPQKRDAKDWVRNTRTGKPLETDWVFAGSSFWRDEATGEEYYQADGGDLVCVSNFPTAMLDLPIASSQSNEALLFEVFDSRVPPRGTPVELVFSAVTADGR